MTSTIRRTVLAGAAAVALGGTGLARAQTAPAAPPPPPPSDVRPMPGPNGGPPPGGPMGGPMAGHGPMEAHGPMMHHAWMHHGPDGWMHRPNPFALIYTAPDRRLTPADVQTIVQGFLLWHGNHTWKVGDVRAQGDDAVAFTLTTPDGSQIASFTMNTHDGRVQRTG